MKRKIIWTVITLVLLLAAWRVWVILFTPPPYLNISKEQYAEALSRWRSYQIEEYEIKACSNSRIRQAVTLHVSDSGNKIELVEAEFGTLDDEEEFVKAYTVEGMFKEVGDIINQEPKEHSQATLSVAPFSMYYQVSFDAALGFPTSIEGHPYSEGTVYDADWWRGTTCIKIIKQKAGAPQHPPTAPCPPPMPTPTPPPSSVNITRADLNSAQAKWSSQKVEEYEMEIYVGRAGPLFGTWNIRVKRLREEIISYSRDAQMYTPSILSDELDSLSVEGQFEYIDQLLKDDEPDRRGGSNPVDYVIAFDPALGYPVSIEEKDKPDHPAGTLGRTRITRLTILKKSIP